jgi:hypothetical protein
VLARRGALDEAEQLAREAVAPADTTDFLHLRWHVYLAAGEVLLEAEKKDDATAMLENAVAIAEEKGNRVGAQRARDLLAR